MNILHLAVMNSAAGGHLISHVAAAGSVINFSGIKSLMEDGAGAAVAAVGAVMVWRGIGRNIAAVVGSLMIVLLGLLVFGLAIAGEITPLATGLVHTIFG